MSELAQTLEVHLKFLKSIQCR